MADISTPKSFDAKAFQDVINYYNQTRFDYNVAWLNEDNLAVHFGFYDRFHTSHSQALYNTNRILAKITNIAEGTRVLDAGCGRGGSALWLASERGARVTGISPVHTQIEEAQQHAKKRKLDKRVDFIVGDYCQMPFRDASFDVVWACESLCHAIKKGLFYQEAFRVLRPGGKLIIAEYVRSQRPLVQKDEKLLMSWLNRWAIPDIDTPNEHQTHASNAGFTSFALEDYTRFTWISLKNLFKISKRWLWADYLLYLIGIRTKNQHHNIQGSKVQYQALKKGLWFYALIVAEKLKVDG